MNHNHRADKAGGDAPAGLPHIVVGFVSVWFGSMVFSWFGLSPTVLMVIIIGVGFLMNDLNRLRKFASAPPEHFQIELAGAIGSLVGVGVSGIYLLSHVRD